VLRQHLAGILILLDLKDALHPGTLKTEVQAADGMPANNDPNVNGWLFAGILHLPSRGEPPVLVANLEVRVEVSVQARMSPSTN
jgi:hypothetical protein